MAGDVLWRERAAVAVVVRGCRIDELAMDERRALGICA